MPGAGTGLASTFRIAPYRIPLIKASFFFEKTLYMEAVLFFGRENFHRPRPSGAVVSGIPWE
jgi:hypothetical protein